jgi:hypothetical protein
VAPQRGEDEDLSLFVNSVSPVPPMLRGQVAPPDEILKHKCSGIFLKMSFLLGLDSYLERFYFNGFIEEIG